jgi:hypothetical protein
MPAQVSWHLENRIVGIRVFDTVTIADVNALSDTIIALFEASDTPLIHLLVDESDMTDFPKQFRDIYRVGVFMKHPQMGWFIIYGGNNALFRVISHLVTQLMRLRHRHFDTLEDAVEFLQSMDSTLPKLIEVTLSQ